MRCLNVDKSNWTRQLRHENDEKIKKRLAATTPEDARPSWDCGEDRWRLWKRLVIQEAHRRGLKGDPA